MIPSSAFDSPAGAELSACGRYRWWLSRRWDGLSGPCDYLPWVMLNPSDADASRDDPTVRRCMHFSRAWGFEGLLVVNLYGWRSPHPDRLLEAQAAGADIMGQPTNDLMVQAACRGQLTLAAWGASSLAAARELAVLALLREVGARLHVLGRSATGAPLHPMARGRSRVPDRAQPAPW